MCSSLQGKAVVRSASGFLENRGQAGDGTGDRGALEGGKLDPEDAALAVADAYLHLRAAIGAGDSEPFAHDCFVKRVGGSWMVGRNRAAERHRRGGRNSIATCEVCSAPGQLADRNGWTSVKCADHENWSRLDGVF
jgi:hypothetical protein